MPFAFELFVLLGLTLLNAFFSGAEIAILSVRKSRLRELADMGRRSARAALALREKPEPFLATVQVGITVVGATSGAFGGAALEAPLAEGLRGLGAGRFASGFALALVVAGVSMLSIVLGELVPKSLALRSGEVVALAVARPLRVLASLFRPFVWFLTGASNLVLRPFRDSTTFTESRLSPEELRQLVEEAAAAGTLDARAGEIATRAIDLGGLRAAAVMVPRGKIVWLSAVASPEAVRATLRTKPHGRYPVRGASEDDILGYVVARDVYHQLLEGSFDLRRIVREVSFFPEGVSAVELLRALQEKAAPLGLLVDETGLVAGLVSPSDIADELVGEMVADGGGRAIVAERDGTYLVDAATPVHEVSRALGVELPTGPTFSTLAGLLITTAGTIPPPGAKLTLPGGVEAEVVDASRQRVRRARLRVPPPAPADSEPA